MAGFVNDLLEAIPAYTGLSPSAFFTTLALVYAVYNLVSKWFAPPPPPPVSMREPPPPPKQMGDVSAEELLAYDGTDESKPLLMAIKGQIYDVSMSRIFYGPGGPYALFAGKDASRALAKMSFEAEDLTGNLDGLSPYELDALTEWEYKFMSKYVKVGQIKEIKVTDANEELSTPPKEEDVEKPQEE